MFPPENYYFQVDERTTVKNGCFHFAKGPTISFLWRWAWGREEGVVGEKLNDCKTVNSPFLGTVRVPAAECLLNTCIFTII